MSLEILSLLKLIDDLNSEKKEEFYRQLKPKYKLIGVCSWIDGDFPESCWVEYIGDSYDTFLERLKSCIMEWDKIEDEFEDDVEEIPENYVRECHCCGWKIHLARIEWEQALKHFKEKGHYYNHSYCYFLGE